MLKKNILASTIESELNESMSRTKTGITFKANFEKNANLLRLDPESKRKTVL